jgi:hypothetical protein
MRAALVIIFWLTLVATFIGWQCRLAGVTWGDFCRGFVAGFLKGEDNYGSVGWRLGHCGAGVAWSLILIVGIIVFMVVFFASFMWAGVI